MTGEVLGDSRVFFASLRGEKELSLEIIMNGKITSRPIICVGLGIIGYIYLGISGNFSMLCSDLEDDDSMYYLEFV